MSILFLLKETRAAAQKKFEEEFGRESNKTFADLLTDWAFVEDSNITPLSVRRFAISCMKDWIYKGFEKHAQMYREKIKNAYTFNVDGCEITSTEDDFDQEKKKLLSITRRISGKIFWQTNL